MAMPFCFPLLNSSPEWDVFAHSLHFLFALMADLIFHSPRATQLGLLTSGFKAYALFFFFF